ILGTIPDELRVVAVDRLRAPRERLEIHFHDRKHRRLASVAENRTSELLSGQEFLHQDGLLVVLQQELGLAEKLVAIAAEIAVGDSLGRSLVERLHKKRKRELPGQMVKI